MRVLDIGVITFSSVSPSLFTLLFFLSIFLSDGGCAAESYSLGHSPSHAVSNHCWCPAPSFFSLWICGEDRHFPEVCWSDSPSSFLPLLFCLLEFYFLTFKFVIGLSLNTLMMWNIIIISTQFWSSFNFWTLFIGFQALIQYQAQQCAASARTSLQVP